MENKNLKEKKEENVMLGYFRGYKKVVDNTPKQEAEVQYESPRDKKRYSSSNLVVLVTILAVLITSGVLLYALYSFIHVSRISNLAGIHLTKEFQQATSELIGGEADQYPLAGYEDWQTYKDKTWEFKYPSDWQLSQNGSQINLKKYNKKQYNYFDSLALAVEIRQMANPGNLNLEKFLSENNFPAGERIQTEISGSKAWRTGVFKDSQGLARRNVYWPLDGGSVIIMETTFYNSDYEALFGDYEKMLSSVKFL